MSDYTTYEGSISFTRHRERFKLATLYGRTVMADPVKIGPSGKP